MSSHTVTLLEMLKTSRAFVSVLLGTSDVEKRCQFAANPLRVVWAYTWLPSALSSRMLIGMVKPFVPAA